MDVIAVTRLPCIAQQMAEMVLDERLNMSKVDLSRPGRR